MIGIAPKVRGYAGVVGDALPVSGKYTRKQAEAIRRTRKLERKRMQIEGF
jgi:hypothetical protein